MHDDSVIEILYLLEVAIYDIQRFINRKDFSFVKKEIERYRKQAPKSFLEKIISPMPVCQTIEFNDFYILALEILIKGYEKSGQKNEVEHTRQLIIELKKDMKRSAFKRFFGLD